ncbi:MAG TPA: hypothetical protein VJ810_37290, partial [Blastocatellia bacterium]|nr:hypothetical protein [Blastocatellia bacterium]
TKVPCCAIEQQWQVIEEIVNKHHASAARDHRATTFLGEQLHLAFPTIFSRSKPKTTAIEPIGVVLIEFLSIALP